VDKINLPINPEYIWPIAGGIIGLGAFLLILALGYFTRISSYARQPVTPVLTIIPGPSATPLPTNREVESTQPITTTSPSSPPSPEASVALGQFVEVFGTGGDGLRLRTHPNLSGDISLLVVENEVLKVEDGPIEGDGYLWWYLVNPYDNSKKGWAAANYLRPIASP
jgi:hypothetical protein